MRAAAGPDASLALNGAKARSVPRTTSNLLVDASDQTGIGGIPGTLGASSKGIPENSCLVVVVVGCAGVGAIKKCEMAALEPILIHVDLDAVGVAVGRR